MKKTRRTRWGPKVPEVVKCGGGGRNLLVKSYSGNIPAPDVPDERVTWTVVPQGVPTYVVHCTCAHYTVVDHFERRRFQGADAEKK